jgi:acyl-homoserine-lactone acylase
MRRICMSIWFLIACSYIQAQDFSAADIQRWKTQASRVTIIRDQWGIPHVYGKSDADAVFGLLYAQCEDDFARVEMNYIDKLGRKAEVLGEKAVAEDLYTRLIIDTTEAIKDYQRAPEWLKKLLQAYADGIHYFLYTHPNQQPVLLQRFQPWFPLLWTDGSIGAISTGDIDAIETAALYRNPLKIEPTQTASTYTDYSDHSLAALRYPKKYEDPFTGSNGFAIAPKNTVDGHALLYINPHTSFYFRPEVQMVSEEGLQTYGAVTWGQFFIYQGFNQHTGWMHTSSNIDVSDMYALKTTLLNGQPAYYYDDQIKPISQKSITLKWKTTDGFQTKTVQAWYTHLGPIMAAREGKYIAVAANNRDMNGLIQSWLRTKTKNLKEFKEVMAYRANPSNNTVYADAAGNIAYWHGNFVPIRDTVYDWGKVVDGSRSATAWKGIHPIDEIIQVVNPATGWIQNCNSTPFTVSGESSPNPKNYPSYMAPDGENFRGVNAVRLLQREKDFNLSKLMRVGYDRTLTAFTWLVPALVKAYDAEKNQHPEWTTLQGMIDTLRTWNFQSSTNSIATTLAIEWAGRLNPVIRKIYVDVGEKDQVAQVKYLADTASASTLVRPLIAVQNTLLQRFGSWQIPWGDINRLQRTNGQIQQQFNDSLPSLPVAYAAAIWGMLPSFNSNYFPGTKKRYGFHGNSFVCAVEFGKKIRAKSILTGGNASNPTDPHFADQLAAYANGQFKDVLFYREDVVRHAVKTYRPGEQIKK